MRGILHILFHLVLLESALGQLTTPKADSLFVFFREIEDAAQREQKMWNSNLYGPLILVDPQTREVYTNEPDSAGLLKPKKEIYAGILPANINIANTAITWGGKRWAMVMLPLPQHKVDRINLLAHELFHRAQPSLGFELYNPVNNHLDQKDGRIYLRLELNALTMAFKSSSSEAISYHLRNALIFRKYRHSIYPKSSMTENELELNEGIAEYTGVMFSGREPKEMTAHFLASIKAFLHNPTYIRSFAYQTTPCYGYFLSKKRKGWNMEITNHTNLTKYFMESFNITLPTNLQSAVKPLFDLYDGRLVVQQELSREKKIKSFVQDCKKKFIEDPHVEIQFDQMTISFDPRNIVPIDDKGTYYPNIRVTDKWGILTVTNGALVSANWDKISLTNPTIIDTVIAGNGWVLDLKKGYSLGKDTVSGNYVLKGNKDDIDNIKN